MTADAKGPLVVSTEPKPIPPAPKGPCPACKALPGQRVRSSGFGRVAKELCGACGYDFGVIQL
jgi:hypothetical protein